MPLFEPVHPFSGVHSVEYNALNEAIIRCAEDLDGIKSRGETTTGSYSHYDWLGTTQKRMIVTQLIDKLHESGYHIEKRSGDEPSFQMGVSKIA